MTTEEMKRQHRAKQEKVRELKAERAEHVARGEPVPWRVDYRLQMARVEAEELRMWGNRELTCEIQEATA